jgi:biotin carboxyl carrier protein
LKERYFVFYSSEKDPEVVEVLVKESGILEVTVGGRQEEFTLLPLDSYRALILSSSGKTLEVLYQIREEILEITLDGKTYTLEVWNEVKAYERTNRTKKKQVENILRVPMSGKVTTIFVAEGEEVEEGTPLLIVEAMKMENEFKSPKKGKVKKIFVQKGDVVEPGTPLVEIE